MQRNTTPNFNDIPTNAIIFAYRETGRIVPWDSEITKALVNSAVQFYRVRKDRHIPITPIDYLVYEDGNPVDHGAKISRLVIDGSCVFYRNVALTLTIPLLTFSEFCRLNYFYFEKNSVRKQVPDYSLIKHVRNDDKTYHYIESEQGQITIVYSERDLRNIGYYFHDGIPVPPCFTIIKSQVGAGFQFFAQAMDGITHHVFTETELAQINADINGIDFIDHDAQAATLTQKNEPSTSHTNHSIFALPSNAINDIDNQDDFAIELGMFNRSSII